MIITRGFLTALECIRFVFGRGSAPDPLGELTALPQTPSWLKRVLLLTRMGGKGRGRKKRKGDGRKREARALVAPRITPTGGQHSLTGVGGLE